ncbi:MAG: metallophosphoesterase, partial [Gammaproteobacteria bacterium]
MNNWNSIIGLEDVVLCLGDFTQNLKHKKNSMALVEKYSGMLNGKKILIRGNHDAEDTSWYYDCGWNCLIEYPLIIQNRTMSWLSAPTRFCGCIICDINGYRILFSHFAIYE